jgi:hypothetical protein
MIKLPNYKFVRTIQLPILVPGCDRFDNIELLRVVGETTFLLGFTANIMTVVGLSHAEELIKYITDNKLGTYYCFKFPYAIEAYFSNPSWVNIYFNNISTQLLLEYI